MRRKFLLLFLLFFCGQHFVWAQKQTNQSKGLDFDNQDPAMNERYNRGRHLVYDCDGYYVCTKEEEFHYCLKRREEALSDLDVDLYCAPIKAFSSEEECHQEQQRYTDSARFIPFCLHPQEKFLR